MRNVKKAYPYAVAARDELAYMNSQLVGVEGKRERERYIKEYEKQMFKKYENMTPTEYRKAKAILLKY